MRIPVRHCTHFHVFCLQHKHAHVHHTDYLQQQTPQCGVAVLMACRQTHDYWPSSRPKWILVWADCTWASILPSRWYKDALEVSSNHRVVKTNSPMVKFCSVAWLMKWSNTLIQHSFVGTNQQYRSWTSGLHKALAWLTNLRRKHMHLCTQS